MNKIATEVVCEECGQTFQDTIYCRQDGSQTNAYKKCPACREKEGRSNAEQKLQLQLKEAVQDQEGVWFDECSIPDAFALKTFEDFDAKLQPKAFKAVKNLQWQWQDGAGKDGEDIPPQSLVLLSPSIYGLGKTHLVCALINQIIETEEKAIISQNTYIRKLPCPVYYTAENTLLRRIRQTFNRSNAHNDDKFYEETENDVYKKLARPDLLIIDDVGKVRPRDLNFLQGVYFNIIDQRYTDSHPIILTTNLDLSELEEHIGGACADRIREMAGSTGFIKMTGKSYRQRRDSDKLPVKD